MSESIHRVVLQSMLAVLTMTSSAAAYEKVERLPLSSGGTLAVRSEASGVKVRAGEGSEAVVTIRSDREDFEKFFVVRVETPRADRAEVVIERRSRTGNLFGGGFQSKTTVDVTLPRASGAEIESSGGGIDISGLDGPVRAESSGGGVRVSDLGATARLSSSGGSIRGERVAGDIEASSSGGGVELSDAGGRVNADSSGGSVSVGFAAGNAKGGNLESSGGGVKAYLDPAVALEVDASSSGGSVRCDLPVTVQGRVSRDSLNGKLNGGGARLELRSSGGGISIASR